MNINMQTVDARGLSCPLPPMLTRKAIQKLDKGTIEVLVDSGTARENVSRMAESMGCAITIEEQTDGSTRIVLKK
jgi:TusA-related sulfurtransferase